MKEWCRELKVVLIVLVVFLVVLAVERYFDAQVTNQERVERIQKQIQDSRKFDP